MKKGWEIKTLGDLCSFENGDRGTNYPSKSFRAETGIPFINAGHLTDDGIDLTNMNYITRERYNLLGSGKIQKGDILFCLRGSLGKFASVGDLPEGQIASSLVIVRPSKSVLHKYLLAYFQSQWCSDGISEFSNGAAQPNLSAQSLSKFKIPIPPLPEQQRIVSLLDEAFESIAGAKVNAERNLVNAQELFESYLQAVFANKGNGWEEKSFEDVCVLQRGFDLPKQSRTKGVHPLVSSNGITDRLDVWKVKAPGVVTGRSGTIGNVHYIEEDYWPLNTALYIKDFHGNYERFVYYFLKQFDLGKYSSGAGVPTLNRNNVHSVKVYFPKSLAEQRAIVARLDVLSAETKKLEGIYEQKIDALEELKKSVLARAFGGEM